jgi:hypothetical protein
VAQKAVNMNIRIFTRLTGTPELRAASASPPEAKIQLPKRVLGQSSTWPKITRPIAQTISIGMPSTTGWPGAVAALKHRSAGVAQPDEQPLEDLAAKEAASQSPSAAFAMPPMMVLRSTAAAGRW